MSAKRLTQKDILDALTKVIEDNSPNGDLKRLMDQVDLLQQIQTAHNISQDEQFAIVDTAIHKLEKKLYNPDDGIVVSLKDNTRITRETRDCAQRQVKLVGDLEHEVKKLKNWKAGVVKMIWILVPIGLTAVTYAAKLVFN